MTDTVLKFRSEPEGGAGIRKTSLMRLLRERLRLILLVIVPLLALIAGLVFYLAGGRTVSTDNAYVGAQKVLVTPDISGKVASVRVKEGERVAAGDVLFEIDPTPFRLALSQAQSKLEGARTDFNNMKSNLKSLDRLVELAQQNVALKQKDVERKATLLAKSSGAQADLDNSMSATVTAQLQAQLAVQQQATTRNALLGNPDLPIEQYPPYQQAKAVLEQAERDLNHTTLKAPIGGTATQVDNIQLGRFVTAGTPILSVIDDGAPWVDANPKETDLTYVRVGQKVVDRRRRVPGPCLPRHRELDQSRHRGAIRDPAAAERHRQLGEGGAARAGPHRLRRRAGYRLAARRHERDGRHRYRPAALAEVAARVERRRHDGPAAVNLGRGSRWQRPLVTICAMAATIMQALDTTIANVALPYMQGSLSASLDQINWVLTSYIVASAIMTAPIGWIADRFGRKKLFIVCTAGFTVASMLCGLAGNIGEMVAFRLLQGVFGAALVPLSQAVLLDSYSAAERGSAMAIWGIGVMLGPIMGPTLGAWLTDNYNWHWVFFINLPVGIVTVIGLMLFMEETQQQKQLRFDWFGFLALAVGIGAMQLMLDRGEQLGWFEFDRDHRRDGGLDDRLLLLPGAFADQRAAVRPLRHLQGPELRRRLPVHGHHRAGAVRHHGAGDAVHAERARLPDPHRRLPARRARRRHADRHADGGPSHEDHRAALPGAGRDAARDLHARPDGRLHGPDLPAHDRGGERGPGLRPGPGLRSAEHGRVRDPAGAPAHRRNRHPDAGPQSRQLGRHLGGDSRAHQHGERHARPAGRIRSRRSTTPWRCPMPPCSTSAPIWGAPRWTAC